MSSPLTDGPEVRTLAFFLWMISFTRFGGLVAKDGFPLTLHKRQGFKSPNHQSKPLTRVVSTIQIQHTESYRCVLQAIGIEKQVSQPQIVSKTIAANRFESHRFVSVSVGVCFEGPFGARRAAASCCCAGGCLAREALAKSLRGCLEEILFGEMESQENTLRLFQANSILNNYRKRLVFSYPTSSETSTRKSCQLLGKPCRIDCFWLTKRKHSFK